MPANALFTPEECGGLLDAEELRTRIHHHLMAHPNLTAFEIARALHLLHPAGAGANRVRRSLLEMEDDGEAIPTPGPRAAGDARLTTRWEAA
jgi:hypothetical protein